MGYVRHHAIVVTSSREQDITGGIAKATELGLVASVQSPRTVNGYRSFLVCPDGSKEGWAESDEGDVAREAFIAWLRAQRYDDGSSNIEWVEVSYGSDDKSARIERSEWRPRN